MAMLDNPSAANRQMRARSTVRWGVVFARTQFSNVVLCPSVIGILSAVFHMY
jgi:hypothetical protein